MKISPKKNAIGLLISLFTLFCTTIVFAGEAKDLDRKGSQDVKQETMEAIQAIKSYSIEQRDQAVKEAKQVMEDIDARIEQTQADIQKKWGQMDQSARDKTSDTLKALKAQRYELSEWYGGLKHSSSSAWDHVRKGFVDGYESITNAFDKARKEIASDAKGNKD